MSELIDLALELIRRPSITPDDAGCQDLIASRLQATGFTTERLDHNGVKNLWATFGQNGPLICLAGHTDVVPPGPLEAWTHSPFEPQITNGEIIGRGAADMKGAVAAMVIALEKFAANPNPNCQVALLLTSDEEGPGVYGTRHVLDVLEKRGTKIDHAIVCEPTSEISFGDTIKVGRRGSINGRITITGHQGHTAYPALADNAIHRLSPILARLLEIDWGHGNDVFEPTTLQVSNIHGGSGATNVIPGQATLDFNMRFGTDSNPEAILNRIQTAIGDSRAHLDFKVSSIPFVNAGPAWPNFVNEIVNKTVGIRPNHSTNGGTSDARYFASHQIPVVELGPKNATIHAINETVSVKELVHLASVLSTLLAQYS
jgi:succinyl-diaminopimelate desuccinylase